MKINLQYHHVLSLSVCAQNCGHTRMLIEATGFTEARIKCHAHRGHTTDTERICNITRGNCCGTKVATRHHSNSCTGDR